MLLAPLALAGCDQPAAGPAAPSEEVSIPEPSGPPAPQNLPDAPAPQPPGGWESAASAEGMALRLTGPDGKLLMSVACLGRPPTLTVSVPGFSPIGSEDRFALAVGDEPVTLVADPNRQPDGVTGRGPVPEGFGTLLAQADRIGALYGTQRVEPAAPPPAELARLLTDACSRP